jgi:UDP-N-acetylmuramate dehydrogenase
MTTQKILKNVVLAPYTSFGVGGVAENFVIAKSAQELIDVLKNNTISPVWLLGFGSNVLISDDGLPGLVVYSRGGETIIKDDEIFVDAGVWWDDVVKKSIDNNLWGIELLSEIPGSVGGALFINIAAYGQSIGNAVKWIDVWDKNKQKLIRLDKEILKWDYKKSVFQNQKYNECVILRACLKLSKNKTDEIKYQKALDVATEHNLNPELLEDRRKIIIESRRRAGSLWDPENPNVSRTVGSFFRNPVVTPEQAENIIKYDETGKTKDEILAMNKVHGGASERVSAAHVMLACGFKRGQKWNRVKLNDQNLLKIEALVGASAQEIFDVVVHIQKTCKTKLGIELQTEAQILGKFN